MQHSQFIHIFMTKSVCINLNLILLNYFYYVFSSSICLLYSIYVFVKCLKYVSVRIQITVLIPHNKQAQTRLPLGKHFLIFLAEKEPPSFPVLLLRTSIMPPYALLHNTIPCILVIHILICLSQEIINTLRRGIVFLAYST